MITCLEKLYNRLTLRVFRELLSFCVNTSFHFGFDLIALVPYQCISLHFSFKVVLTTCDHILYIYI